MTDVWIKCYLHIVLVAAFMGVLLWVSWHGLTMKRQNMKRSAPKQDKSRYDIGGQQAVIHK